MAELTRNETSIEKQAKRPGLVRFLFLLALGAVVLVGLWYFTTAMKKATPVDTHKERTVSVSVAVAKSASVPIEIKSIGNVLAYSVVNVVPQVSGQLRQVYFRQGQYVKKGDLLFEIDPSLYQAALAQAQGNVDKDAANVQQAEAALARDQAQVGQAQANLMKDQAQASYAGKQNQRYNSLLTQGAVSHEQSDQMETNLSVANAAILADQKQIENTLSVVNADRAAIKTAQAQLETDRAIMRNAQIQLGWTTIRSPIDGKTGSLNVYAGNVVTAQNNQPLVSIAQVKPIYVTFTVPEQNLDQVRAALRAKTLKITANIEGVKANAVEGDVNFLENTVNTNTGTVTMRASFSNEDHHLFPGQFVDVTVSIPSNAPSVVVPTTALQTTQQGTAVFVVKPDNTVYLAPVTVDRSNVDIAALGSGIKTGDVVVTDGQLQLGPGTKVKVTQDNKQGRGHSRGGGGDASGNSWSQSANESSREANPAASRPEDNSTPAASSPDAGGPAATTPAPQHPGAEQVAPRGAKFSVAPTVNVQAEGHGHRHKTDN
jgi:multidrug efflux system membrane fusion protein